MKFIYLSFELEIARSKAAFYGPAFPQFQARVLELEKLLKEAA